MPSPLEFGLRDDICADPRTVLSSLGEVVYTWDVPSDTLQWGPNAAEVLGALPAAVLQRGLAFAGLVEPGSGRSRYDAIFGSAASDVGDGAIYRTRYAVNLAGRRMWVDDTGRWFAGADGRPARAHGVLRLERMAHADELNGSFGEHCDRSSLIRRVETCLAEHLPQDRPVVVLIAAIEELARLNDDFGQDATEEIVQEVQERLGSVLRRRDSLMRYSDSRFAILLANCPAGQVEHAKRRFSAVVARSAIETSRGIALVRLCTGTAAAPDLSRHAGTLVAAAEKALVDAVEGGDRIPHAEGGDVPETPESMELEALAALNERRVYLALQPVVAARGRVPVFSEALLRVERHMGGTYFAPAELVPLLERRGLMGLFDHRVLELGLGMLAEQPELRISINVSPRSLCAPEWFETFMAGTQGRPQLAARLLVEITETATIEDPTRIADQLARIKEQGARIAIDDFGAGHTSLRHLRAFPIDVLKFDGAFTQNLHRSTDDRFFVRTLLSLAQHLGVETVAEWVDDERQASMLTEWGVTYLQGHLIGKAEIPVRSGMRATRRRAAG